MDDNKELKRKIKMSLLMADNDGNKKENHKFLYEFECFREEFDDEDIPEVLREAALNAEYELNIPLEDGSNFKNVSNMEWHDESSKSGAVVRDNDKRQVREMFCEEHKYWRPLFGYKVRENLAMEYCKCNECTFLTKKRINREEGLSPITREDFYRAKKGKEELECTKTKFYLPYVERDDDMGEYPPDEHYIDVTIPALEEGMQVMEEEMKKGVRTKRGPSAN